MILVGMNTWNGRPAFNGNRPWMFRDAFMTSTLRVVFTDQFSLKPPMGFRVWQTAAGALHVIV
jgi:hypothetical protein